MERRMSDFGQLRSDNLLSACRAFPRIIQGSKEVARGGADRDTSMAAGFPGADEMTMYVGAEPRYRSCGGPVLGQDRGVARSPATSRHRMPTPDRQLVAATVPGWTGGLHVGCGLGLG